MTTARRVDVGPGELAVLETGAGGRPLLLLHGFTGGADDFVDHLVPLAEDGWHVVAPNQRGHVDSYAPGTEAGYSLRLFAAEALALADALGWGRFALLGHSMGGMIAQILALQAAQRLDGLVLMDTCHGPVDIDPAMAMSAVELVRAKGIDALAELLAGQADGGPLETPAARRIRETRPDLVAEGERRLRACSPAMYAAMVVEMLGPEDRLEALAGLDAPTLVVVGEQDAPFLAPSRRLAEALPGARLEVIADAGHSPQVEAPEAWAKALRTFLAELAGRAAR
ncbi:MAG: alpha/beta hydrolase [Acidimicrobiia bacterium]|nr:alpha/beta hydrolase [Acidimicrobiia bacterium]